MECPARSLALGIALAVNVAALAVVNTAMVDGAERDRLYQQEPLRVEITAPKPAATDSEQQARSAANCSPARL